MKKAFVVSTLAMLATGALADDSQHGLPTHVRPLEVTPIIGRAGTELYHADSAKVPSILHIWATWCGPCRRELPSYLEFSKHNPKVFMAAIAWTDDIDMLVRYLMLLPCDVQKRVSGNMVFMASKGSDLQDADTLYWGVNVFPSTLFVAADGTIVKRVEGTIDWKSKKTRNGVKRFLQGQSFDVE